MILFLYGPDDYRREERRRFIVEEFVKNHSGIGVERFDFLEEGALPRFVAFVREEPLFGGMRLAVCENVFEEKGEELKKALARAAKDERVVALLASRGKPAKEFTFLLKPPARGEKFEFLTGAAWERFVGEEAKKQGVPLALPAVRFLAEAYCDDTWRLVTELQKIAQLGRQKIEKKDLEELDVEIAPDFWSTLTRLKAPSLRERLLALEKLFAMREPPGKTFNILSSVWSEKGDAFAAYDFLVKSGRLDYEEVLVDLAIS